MTAEIRNLRKWFLDCDTDEVYDSIESDFIQHVNETMQVMIWLVSRSYRKGEQGAGSPPPIYTKASAAFAKQQEIMHEIPNSAPDYDSLQISNSKHLSYFKELLQFIKETRRVPDEFQFTQEAMCEACIAYYITQYIAHSQHEFTGTNASLRDAGKIAYATLETRVDALDKSDSESYTSEQAEEIDTILVGEEHHLFNAEEKKGEYWITLHGITAHTGISDEDAVTATLCWTEWFRAYVNRGGQAKQACAGVLLQIGPSVRILENGGVGARSHALLAAQLMRYAPCRRPMLWHCGPADSRDMWYVNENRHANDADLITARITDESETKTLRKAHAKFHTDANAGGAATPASGGAAGASITNPDGSGTLMPAGGPATDGLGPVTSAQTESTSLQSCEVSTRVPAVCLGGGGGGSTPSCLRAHACVCISMTAPHALAASGAVGPNPGGHKGQLS